ncbi:MAG: acetate--CoA ligase family protein [Chloroflexi bacterium]|nr:acetate--CoA ligase family protein [Chloroflexota bacterium]
MTESRNVLTEVESKEFLRRAGIPVVPTKLARSKREALSIGKEMGFPVVLKICSHDVVHKTDSGGVRLGLSNAAQVGRAYSEIVSSVRQAYPEARIQGVSVQPMAPPAVEVIVGMSKDPQFGPVLMFGLGGILVEVLKDVSFRIVPVSERDAGEMVREIKGYPILKGYRGQKPASIPALEKLIVKVSQFVEKNPQIEELDLNPVFAYPDKAVAVDARIILE